MNTRPDQADPATNTPAYAAAVVFLLLATAVFVARGPGRALSNSADFGLYYCSTAAVLNGDDPYTADPLRALAEARGVPTNFIDNAIAPPFSYAPIVPFAVLGWPAAKALWLVCNLAAAALLFVWLARLAGIPLSSRRPVTLVWAGWVVGFAPLQTCIGFGQLAVLSAALCAGALYFDQRGRWRVAAALWCVAGLLKPQLAAPLMAYFIYRRQWRLIAATTLAGIVVTLAVVGWLQFNDPGWYDAWAGNIDRLTAGGASDFARPDNPYIFGNLQLPIYILSGSKPVANALAWAAAAALAVLAVWRLRRPSDPPTPRTDHDHLGIAALCLAIGLLPIYHVYYDHTVLLAAVAWALGLYAALGPSRTGAWAIPALSAALLLPGQTALFKLSKDGVIPAGLAESAGFRALAIAHLPWLTAAVCVVLIVQLSRANPGPASGVSTPAE